MLHSFFNRVNLRLNDIKTIKTLCLGAERYAYKNGEESPGAEHFLLAAVDLSDGTAGRVFEEFGVGTDEIEEAIKNQYHEALEHVGIVPSKIDLESDDPKIAKRTNPFYETKPSAQSMMKELAALRKHDKDTPLLGLHVLEVLSAKELGVVARTLNSLKIDQASLKEAIAKELISFKQPK